MFTKNLRYFTLWHNPKDQMPNFTKDRVSFLGIVFLFSYIILTYRLFYVAFMSSKIPVSYFAETSKPRADIIDANGTILATDIVTYSVFVDPYAVVDKLELARELHKLFPALSEEELKQKLSQDKRFVWVARHVMPSMKDKIQDMGLSGIYFREEYKRIYPHGPLMCHVLGYCDQDGVGLCGIEKSFEQKLKASPNVPVKLSLDLRIQHIVFDALIKGIKKFNAKAGNVLIMDNHGQIISSVSAPSYDPDLSNKDKIFNTFNRNFQGCYEPGSALKILNVAIALQMGTASFNSSYDARNKVKIGKYAIGDFHAKNRVLSFTEAFVHSSNIAMIKMATDFGSEFGIGIQKLYFQKLGLLDKAPLEVQEVETPIVPRKWSECTFKTLSYGYGLAMSPVSFLSAVATVLNDGCLVKPSLLKEQKVQTSIPVFSKEVSLAMRKLMREVVLKGTGRKINIPHYHILAKTGSAEQLNASGGGYDHNSRNTTLISCIVDGDKQYYIVVMLEGPQPTPETHGFATAAWNAGPITREIIERCAPLLGVNPHFENNIV